MSLWGSWDAARLQRLGDELAKVVTLRPDGFIGIPDDVAFWSEVAAQCNQRGTSQMVGPVPMMRVPSNELSACVTVEINSLDVSVLRAGQDALYLSDVSSGMSRLMHAILRTSQLVLIGGSDALGAITTWDRKPRPAGSTFWVNVDEPLAQQLVDVARFASGVPTVIASPDGCGIGAVVGAAIIAAREGLSSVAALREIEKRRGPVRCELEDMEELDNFCQRLLLAEFDLRLGVPAGSVALASPKRHKHAKLPPVQPIMPNLCTPPLNAAQPQDQARSPVKMYGEARHEQSPSRGTRRKRASKSPPPELDGWKLA